MDTSHAGEYRWGTSDNPRYTKSTKRPRSVEELSDTSQSPEEVLMAKETETEDESDNDNSGDFNDDVFFDDQKPVDHSFSGKEDLVKYGIENEAQGEIKRPVLVGERNMGKIGGLKQHPDIMSGRGKPKTKANETNREARRTARRTRK